MSRFNAVVTVMGRERNYEFIANPAAGMNFIDRVLQVMWGCSLPQPIRVKSDSGQQEAVMSEEWKSLVEHEDPDARVAKEVSASR